MVKWKRATPDLPLFEEPEEAYAPMGPKVQVRGPGIGVEGIRKQLKEKQTHKSNGHTITNV